MFTFSGYNEPMENNGQHCFSHIKVNFTAPDKAETLAAGQRIESAIIANHEAGSLISGVSKQDAETVVRWAVANSFSNITEDLQDSDETVESTNLRWRCGIAASSVHFALQDLGLPVFLLNTGDMNSAMGRHAFAAVEIPIKDSTGQLANAPFLIDTSYLQFTSNTDNPAYNYSDFSGPHLAQSAEGYVLGESLLRDGFIELTPQNAKLYLDSFNRNNAVFDSIDDYVDSCFDKGKHYSDYDEDDFKRYGFRTNFMDDFTPREKPDLNDLFTAAAHKESHLDAPIYDPLIDHLQQNQGKPDNNELLFDLDFTPDDSPPPARKDTPKP